jgi:hypothetical protein
VSVIQNVAPNIDAVPGSNGLGCVGYVAEDHHTSPNYCQGGGQ